jgi:cytochrome c peroxidase
MNDVYIDGEPINPLGFAWVDPGQGGFIEQLAADDSWRSEANVPASVLALSSPELAKIATATRGKHKVPTLRNVAKRPFDSFPKSYTHNGYFKTLAGLVHFYSTRDVLPPCPGDFPESVALTLGCWPPPEVSENVNSVEVGDLGLSAADEAALVAFLQTLTDEGI